MMTWSAKPPSWLSASMTSLSALVSTSHPVDSFNIYQFHESLTNSARGLVVPSMIPSLLPHISMIPTHLSKTSGKYASYVGGHLIGPIVPEIMRTNTSGSGLTVAEDTVATNYGTSRLLLPPLTNNTDIPGPVILLLGQRSFVIGILIVTPPVPCGE